MSDHPFPSLIIGGLRNLMDLSGIELRPELPSAVPITQKRDGIYYLIGLEFSTAAEAESFANGLAEFCYSDGARLFLKRPPVISQDWRGNCSGVN